LTILLLLLKKHDLPVMVTKEENVNYLNSHSILSENLH